MNETQPLRKLDGCINTFSGRKLDLLNPSPDDINIRDIARGLSYNSHFGGQTPRFFSIAEHCLLVCDLMENEGVTDPKLLMAALLHDASEAYLGDMVKPLKVQLEKFQEIENRMQQVILEKFNLGNDMLMKKIKPFDMAAQEFEYMSFYKGLSLPLKYYSPERSLHEFRKRFFRYLNMREQLTAGNRANTQDKEGPDLVRV